MLYRVAIILGYLMTCFQAIVKSSMIRNNDSLILSYDCYTMFWYNSGCLFWLFRRTLMLITHICINASVTSIVRDTANDSLLMAFSASNHYQNYWWHSVNWTPRNKHRWNSFPNTHSNIFYSTIFENVSHITASRNRFNKKISSYQYRYSHY